MYADRPLCSSALVLAVAAGGAPRFEWSEPCRVWGLRVEDAASGAIVWYMGKDDESLDSPVRYGELPAGAAAITPAAPLEAGHAYRAVLVQRSDGGGVLASTTFTP